MKIKHLIYAALAVLMTACAKEPVGESPLRESLLGRRVNFQASQADPYRTRATYRHDGSFNEGEVMTIYRQYSNDAGISFDAATEAYRVYYLRTRYATGTSIALETDWVPKKGMKGHDPLPKGDFTQTEADSLTWENGKTVRFRSWSRSNLAGCIDRSATNKKQYYPDYSIAEWVTVSGPTLDISMTLKHQGCRIGFTTKSGNELQRAEICTAVSDYLWKDNSTDTEHDESTSEHGKTLAQAMEEAEAVQAVYERMCMPAGVDINTSLLTAMTKTLYDGTTDFSDISTSATGIVKYDTKTPDQIRDDVQRALFTSNLDGRLYMISIPYDMSTGGQKGETLILPACTRIRVWLYDVNDGDKAQQEDFEAAYHIFTLGDIKDNDGNTLFPEGMPRALSSGAQAHPPEGRVVQPARPGQDQPRDVAPQQLPARVARRGDCVRRVRRRVRRGRQGVPRQARHRTDPRGQGDAPSLPARAALPEGGGQGDPQEERSDGHEEA